MATKKKPSAAQLAARAKFIEMVRAKSKAKKSATKKASTKKASTKKVATHKDTKSHNVNIRVVSGIDHIAEYQRIVRLIEYTNKTIGDLKIKLSEYNKKPKGAMRDNDIRLTKSAIIRYKQNLKIYKTVLTQIKKLL